MNGKYLTRSILAGGAVAAGTIVVVAPPDLSYGLVGCDRPPIDSEQTGYRGTGMENIDNPRAEEAQGLSNSHPETADFEVSSEGPKAGEVYQNVEVLTDLSVPEFIRLMQQMTEWVAPEQGCTYCHDGRDFASEDVYTYNVSRQMLKMTRYANANWDAHVADTGVTCYTCHRGQGVPEGQWFKDKDAGAEVMAAGLGNRMMQNMPSDKTALSSLPRDSMERFLVGHEEIQVQGETALPTDHTASIVDTEHTYGLMMHMTDAIGGTCSVCHNTGRLGDWSESPQQREISWHGIRMVRDMNVNHIQPLTSTLPEARLGPTGDAGKVNCTTCHYGEQLPLNGEKVAKEYPGLVGEEDPDFNYLQFGDLGTEGLQGGSSDQE